MTEAVDHTRMVAAAHEVGHLVGLRLAGQQVTAVRVIGHGTHAYGYVHADITIADREQGRAVLVATLAGGMAGATWCERHGLTQPGTGACSTDMTIYRRYRRSPLLRDLGHGELRASARRLVRQHWREIERLAPRLARRGSLSV